MKKLQLHIMFSDDHYYFAEYERYLYAYSWAMECLVDLLLEYLHHLETIEIQHTGLGTAMPTQSPGNLVAKYLRKCSMPEQALWLEMQDGSFKS